MSEPENTAPKQLVAPSRTNQAIVRQYGNTLAKSGKDIRPGQAVFLDRHGLPYGRAKFNRVVSLIRIGIYGSIIGGAVLLVSGSWLWGSALYLAGSWPTISSWYRGTGALMAIGVLAREGQLEEAQRRLDEIPKARKRSPIAYCFTAGNLASHRGEYAAAIAFWREALVRAKGLQRALLMLSIVKALLLTGQTKEAHLMFETVELPPEADRLLLGDNLARVMFVLLDPDATPMSDEELHDRARQALEYSHTGVDLAALGWAFERRGDEQMAAFLAKEAQDRMHYPYLATWWPALQQWLAARATNDDNETDLLLDRSGDSVVAQARAILWAMTDLLAWDVDHPRARRFLARDRAAFLAEWEAQGGDPARLPDVDFTTSMVVAVIEDEGEYSEAHAIERVVQRGNEIVVVVGTRSRPWKMINPASVIRVPRAEGDVQFVDAGSPEAAALLGNRAS